tara:strand:- start:10192 stop:10578 length:387 start_codon:yes stop_codon:yes gene_type:complete
MINRDDGAKWALMKVANIQLTEQDYKDMRSYRRRRKVGRKLSGAGSAALLGSIPLSILSKPGGLAGKVGTGLALGGAFSALGGLGAHYSANRKRQKLVSRLRQRARAMMKRKGQPMPRAPKIKRIRYA